jgi:hypothetical protein
MLQIYQIPATLNHPSMRGQRPIMIGRIFLLNGIENRALLIEDKIEASNKRLLLAAVVGEE